MRWHQSWAGRILPFTPKECQAALLASGCATKNRGPRLVSTIQSSKLTRRLCRLARRFTPALLSSRLQNCQLAHPELVNASTALPSGNRLACASRRSLRHSRSVVLGDELRMTLPCINIGDSGWQRRSVSQREGAATRIDGDLTEPTHVIGHGWHDEDIH